MGVRQYDAVSGGGVPVGEYYGSRGARHMTNHAPAGAIPIPADVGMDYEPSREGMCMGLSAKTGDLCGGHVKKTGDFAGTYCAGHANAERARLKRA